MSSAFSHHINSFAALFLTLFLPCALKAERPQRDPLTYFSHSPMQWHAATKMIQKLRLKGNERVLELECCDGRVAAALASKLPSGGVLAIDNSAEMIGHAKRYYEPNSLNNLRYETAAAEEIDFEGGFDLVLATDSLLWVEDHSLLFTSVWRALKPGGLFLATIPTGLSPALQATYDKLLKDPYWAETSIVQPIPEVSSSNYLRAIYELGFLPKRIEMLAQKERFVSLKQFSDFMMQWVAWEPNATQQKREEFLNELVELYLEQPDAVLREQIQLECPRLEIEVIKPFM